MQIDKTIVQVNFWVKPVIPLSLRASLFPRHNCCRRCHWLAIGETTMPKSFHCLPFSDRASQVTNHPVVGKSPGRPSRALSCVSRVAHPSKVNMDTKPLPSVLKSETTYIVNMTRKRELILAIFLIIFPSGVPAFFFSHSADAPLITCIKYTYIANADSSTQNDANPGTPS